MARKANNSLLLLFQHIFKKTSPTHSTCLHPTHTNTHSRLVHIQHIHAVNSTTNKVAYTVQLEAHKLACIVTAHRPPSLAACVFLFTHRHASQCWDCGRNSLLPSSADCHHSSPAWKRKKPNNQWLTEIRGNVCLSTKTRTCQWALKTPYSCFKSYLYF